jgi:hypothetical protein
LALIGAVKGQSVGIEMNNMLAEIFFSIFVSISNVFAGIWPSPPGQVPLLLPFGLDSIINQGVQGYKILSQAYPPFNDILNAFIILLLFKIILRFMKMIPIIGRTLS